MNNQAERGERLLCRRCGLAGEFAPRRKTCKACCALVRSAWYYRNQARLKEKYRLYARQWRANNPGYYGRKTPQVRNIEVERRAVRKYRSKPGIIEREREYNQAYYAANRERILRNKKSKKMFKV